MCKDGSNTPPRLTVQHHSTENQELRPTLNLKHETRCLDNDSTKSLPTLPIRPKRPQRQSRTILHTQQRMKRPRIAHSHRRGDLLIPEHEILAVDAGQGPEPAAVSGLDGEAALALRFISILPWFALSWFGRNELTKVPRVDL